MHRWMPALPRPLKPGKLRKDADARGLSAAVWLEADSLDRASLWTAADGQVHHDLDFGRIAGLLADEG